MTRRLVKGGVSVDDAAGKSRKKDSRGEEDPARSCHATVTLKLRAKRATSGSSRLSRIQHARTRAIAANVSVNRRSQRASASERTRGEPRPLCRLGGADREEVRVACIDATHGSGQWVVARSEAAGF